MGEEYTLVNVYADNDPNGNEFQQLLQELWCSVEKFPAFKILIGGDFNAISDIDLDVQHTTQADKDRNLWRQPRTKVFQEFIEHTGLNDVWRNFNPTEKRFTRQHDNPVAQTPARLDRFLISDLLLNYSYKVHIGLSFKSDHSPIYFSFYSNRNTPGRNLFRFPSFLLKDEVFKQELSEEIQHFIRLNETEVTPEDKPPPPLLWDTLKAFIRACTIDYLKKLKRKDRHQMKLRTEAENDAIALERERDRQYLNTNRVSELSQQLSEAHARLQEILIHQGQKQLSTNIKRKRIFANTCSAYFFRKVKGVAGALRFLFNDDGSTRIESDEEILQHCAVFYDNLYGYRSVPTGVYSNFSDNPSTLTLSHEQKEILNAEITEDELHLAIKGMKKLASPGLDGLTVPFYQEFWPLIGRLVFENAKYAVEHEHFSIDQRRGLLKLIPKKDKNPGFVTNLRPITLLNVDYKIATKALAARLRDIVPSLIDTDQKGFVRNRYLGENVLEVQTLMKMAETYQNGEEFALLSLDIEKAFDSIDRGFMHKTLENYGFPPYFLQWIRTTQASVQLRIANNGHLSQPIMVNKGVAQGDALSPFLFILMIETLGSFVRTNDRIKGMKLMGEEKKLSMVADDSIFVLQCEKTNFEYFLETLTLFQRVSGLKVNYEKSRLIPLNANPTWKSWQIISGFQLVPFQSTFKYLGTNLNTSHIQSASNFVFNDQLINQVLKLRPIMSTCITGRILQIKTLIASKFVYKFLLLPSPSTKWFKQMERICNNHVWDGGRHCIPRNKMIAPRQEGGVQYVGPPLT